MTADKSDLFPVEPTAETKLTAFIEKHAEPSDDFDWLLDDSFVVEEQPSIAVYRNRRDHILIRQRASYSDDEDSFVSSIAPQNLIALIDRLCEFAGVAGVGKKRR